MDTVAVSADGPVAVANVTAIPMDRPVRLTDHTVLVEDGRITVVGPSGEVEVPVEAAVIDGEGRFLMPGVIDAHVHMSEADAPVYVAHGITSVRNMWGWPGLLTIRERIATGDILGPTIHSYSPGLDGPPAYWPYTQLLTDEAEARAKVRELATGDWIGFKVYRDLARPVYDAIVPGSRSARSCSCFRPPAFHPTTRCGTPPPTWPVSWGSRVRSAWWRPAPSRIWCCSRPTPWRTWVVWAVSGA